MLPYQVGRRIFETESETGGLFGVLRIDPCGRGDGDGGGTRWLPAWQFWCLTGLWIAPSWTEMARPFNIHQLLDLEPPPPPRPQEGAQPWARQLLSRPVVSPEEAAAKGAYTPGSWRGNFPSARDDAATGHHTFKGHKNVVISFKIRRKKNGYSPAWVILVFIPMQS